MHHFLWLVQYTQEAITRTRPDTVTPVQGISDSRFLIKHNFLKQIERTERIKTQVFKTKI